jgi:hypothetical protein
MIYTDEEEKRRYCCGPTMHPAGRRDFFGNPQWCACSHCHTLDYKQSSSDPSPKMSISEHQRVCCDVLKDESNYTVKSEGFQVSLSVQHDPATKKLVKLSADTARARGVELKSEAGFAAFVAPTCCPYQINVRDTNGEKFEIESIKVGNEPVIVNDGRRIFYSRTTTISSFKTGTDRSFLFVSDTGPDAPPRDGSNVVRIKLQRQRQRVQQPVEEVFRSLSSITGGNTVGGGAFVGHLSTVPLQGTWEKDGPPVEFLIQLVNVQSDEERAADNAKYHAYQDAKLQKQIDGLSARQRRLREEADSLEEEKKAIGKKMRKSNAPAREEPLLNV